MYRLKVEDPDKLFFTSDTHFGHFNICRYCNRPFHSRSEMDNALIKEWNSVVPEDGIVVHCGDFTLIHKEDYDAYEKLASRLNGKILLLRGNHDLVPIIPQPGPESKFIAVVDMAQIEVDGVRIFAQHYPTLTYNGDYQVFGHIHTQKDGLAYGMDGRVNDLLAKNQYDVGVDQNNYKPISYWDLCQIFLKRANS